jgi:type II secretory pathway pseudopilin PulG
VRRAILLLGVVALLACGQQQEREAAIQREAALKQTLAGMRQNIARFRETNGRYPHSLAELGPVPKDPLTNAADWRLTTEETVTPSDDFTREQNERPKSVILDVHSAAPGVGSDGKRYSEY